MMVRLCLVLTLFIFGILEDIRVLNVLHNNIDLGYIIYILFYDRIKVNSRQSDAITQHKTIFSAKK